MSTKPSIELINNTTFGVEIEMTGITREAAARVAATVIGGEVSYIGDGYGRWACVDPQGRKWQFASDGSIITTGGRDTSCELETPPLTYSADIEKLQELVRALRRAGAVTGCQYNCGIHVHVSGKGHTPQSIRNFANLFYANDALIRKSLGIRESGEVGGRSMDWCQPIEQGLVESFKGKETFEQLRDAWYRFYGYLNTERAIAEHYNSSRYHILNLHRFFSTLGTPANTVEVRAFNSTLHAGVIRGYILLVLSMNASALTQKNIRPVKNPIMIAGNEKFAMRTWLNRMGWTGEMFKNPHKLFIERLQGDAAWRFGRNGDQYREAPSF